MFRQGPIYWQDHVFRVSLNAFLILASIWKRKSVDTTMTHVSILRSTMGVNSSQDPRFRILAARAAGLFCQRPLHESPIPPPIPQTSALLPSTSSECCNDGWEDMRWWEKTDDRHRLLLHGSQWYPQAGVFFSSRSAPESIPCRDWKQSGSWVHGTMHIQRCSVSKSLSNIENPIEKISGRLDNVQVHAFQKRNGTIPRQGKADRWAPVTSTSISRSATRCFLRTWSLDHHTFFYVLSVWNMWSSMKHALHIALCGHHSGDTVCTDRLFVFDSICIQDQQLPVAGLGFASN